MRYSFLLNLKDLKEIELQIWLIKRIYKNQKIINLLMIDILI